jgi:hypothetical protein
VKIQPFIFNWRGQYNKTCKIESDLQGVFDEIKVINSDDENKKDSWVNIGEDSYFAKQFLTAVDLFDGDIFFHIQGDITFDRWQELKESALRYFDKYKWGIYAPNVDYTWYDSYNADIQSAALRDEVNLKIVSNPDCTVWMIHRDIIEILKSNLSSLANFKYGWGLDLILCANAYLQKRLVLRDYTYTVQHPKGTGYKQDEAFNEMFQLLSMCDINLQQAIETIRFRKEELVSYLR